MEWMLIGHILAACPPSTVHSHDSIKVSITSCTTQVSRRPIFNGRLNSSIASSRGSQDDANQIPRRPIFVGRQYPSTVTPYESQDGTDQILCYPISAGRSHLSTTPSHENRDGSNQVQRRPARIGMVSTEYTPPPGAMARTTDPSTRFL